jgi:hypothetical protein
MKEGQVGIHEGMKGYGGYQLIRQTLQHEMRAVVVRQENNTNHTK